MSGNATTDDMTQKHKFINGSERKKSTRKTRADVKKRTKKMKFSHFSLAHDERMNCLLESRTVREKTSANKIMGKNRTEEAKWIIKSFLFDAFVQRLLRDDTFFYLDFLLYVFFFFLSIFRCATASYNFFDFYFASSSMSSLLTVFSRPCVLVSFAFLLLQRSTWNENFIPSHYAHSIFHFENAHSHNLFTCVFFLCLFDCFRPWVLWLLQVNRMQESWLFYIQI